MHQSVKTPIYGNCTMVDPDGNFMCRCNWDKVEWYLARDLAELLDQNPVVMRLKFVPKGKGNHGDTFYMSERENQCCVCGSRHNLTRHHAVPYQFRKFFPEDIKRHSCHDILPVCVPCHMKYEPLADILRKQISDEMKVKAPAVTKVDNKTWNAHRAAYVLFFHGKNLPEERRKTLMGQVMDFLGHEPTSKELETMAEVDIRPQRDRDSMLVGEQVVKNLTDIQAFANRWRKHFVDTMKPKFMPEHWDVERPVRK